MLYGIGANGYLQDWGLEPLADVDRRAMANAVLKKIAMTAPSSQPAPNPGPVVTPRPTSPPVVVVQRPISPPIASPTPALNQTPIVAPPPLRPPVSSSSADKKIALIIGNGAYQVTSRLRNPINDAKAVANVLRRLGFTEVIELYDLTAAQFVRALQEFGDRAFDYDWAVVFYAGHGMQIDGENFLIPVDAKLRRASHVEDEAISLNRVLSKVRPARKLRLVILDACRNNPFTPRMEPEPGVKRSIGRGLARVEPQGGELVAFAARDGSEADDGDEQNSPFTAEFIQFLEKPDLELNFLFRRVRDGVLRRTGGKQEPVTYGSLPAEELYFHVGAR